MIPDRAFSRLTAGAAEGLSCACNFVQDAELVSAYLVSTVKT